MSITRDSRLTAHQLTVLRMESLDAQVTVLGSKSYTNRYLAIASLSGQETIIDHALLSDDTVYFVRAIEAFGHVRVEIDHESERIHVLPTGRPMRAPEHEIYIGGAVTPIRFLISMAGHAAGTTILTGNARMQERPMGDLLAALPPLGVQASSVHGNGCPPIRVVGGSFHGGATTISGRVSSQFTSSLVINAIRAQADTVITIVDELISKPYVEMTLAALAEMGVAVQRDGYRRFTIRSGQCPRGGHVAAGMSLSNPTPQACPTSSRPPRSLVAASPSPVSAPDPRKAMSTSCRRWNGWGVKPT